MNKLKLCITPFTKKEMPLLMNCPDTYEIISIVSPSGMGIEGMDISKLTNRKDIGIMAMSDLDSGINQSEVVLISDANDFLRPFAINALEKSINQGKDILCYLKLSNEEIVNYKQMSKENNTSFNYYTIDDNNFAESLEDYKYKKTNIPVVFIGEELEACDGYNILCTMAKKIVSTGRTPLIISEEKYNSFFNQPKIKFWSDIDPQLNILKLNAEVNSLTTKNHPDIILIKIPKPMTKFSDLTTYDFGLSAYMISQAIPADYFIYCGVENLVSPDLINNISENFNAKFGFPISALHLSNRTIDATYEDEKGIEVLFSKEESNHSFIEQLRKLGLPVFDFLNKKDFEKFYAKFERDIFEISYGVIDV